MPLLSILLYYGDTHTFYCHCLVSAINAVVVLSISIATSSTTVHVSTVVPTVFIL